jgi:hypothetical protein
MNPKREPMGRTARFFHTPYEHGLSYVEDNRERLVTVIRRAWGALSEEEFCGRVHALASAGGRTFDEALYGLWEKLTHEGTGALFDVRLPGERSPPVEEDDD